MYGQNNGVAGYYGDYPFGNGYFGANASRRRYGDFHSKPWLSVIA